MNGNIAQMLVRFVTCLHAYGFGTDLRVLADCKNEMLERIRKICDGQSSRQIQEGHYAFIKPQIGIGTCPFISLNRDAVETRGGA